MQGKLIVFEGGEGAGKSTQLERLQGWLLRSPWAARWRQSWPEAGLPVVVTREPGGTALGMRLRQLLLGSEAGITPTAELLMYAADRAEHVAAYIQPHLQQGKVVLCDRYTASTVAYQGYGRELDLGLIAQLNQIATGGLVSDLTLWFDIEVALGLARVRQRSADGRYDRMEAGELGFHERIRQGFADLARQEADRTVRLDGSQGIEEIAGQVQAVVAQRLAVWYPNLLER